MEHVGQYVADLPVENKIISMESSGLVTLLEDAIYTAGEGLTTYRSPVCPSRARFR
jgi:hypothetical protein